MSQEAVDAAFTGFAALPANASTGKAIFPDQPWYDVLQVSPVADAAVIKAAYRQVLANAHPDRGGTVEQFERVQRASARRWKQPEPEHPDESGQSATTSKAAVLHCKMPAQWGW